MASICGGRLTAASMRSLQICIAYGAASITIGLIYKSVLSGWDFQAKFLLLAAQQAVSLLFCLFAKRFLSGYSGFEVPDVNSVLLADAVWPGALNVANIVVGFYAINLVNIPLFLCLRRTATAMVLASEYFLRGKVESGQTMFAVGLVVVGALIAGGDAVTTGSTLGMSYTLLNNGVCVCVWENTIWGGSSAPNLAKLTPPPPSPQCSPHGRTRSRKRLRTSTTRTGLASCTTTRSSRCRSPCWAPR